MRVFKENQKNKDKIKKAKPSKTVKEKNNTNSKEKKKISIPNFKLLAHLKKFEQKADIYQPETPKSRDFSIDILRGSAIILMLITHINVFFGADQKSFWDFFTYWGATLCFSVFLYCFSYVHGLKLTYERFKIKKTVIRIISLLLVYYFTAISAYFFTNKSITFENIVGIIAFIIVPGFTEFILAFVLYEILILALYKPIEKVMRFSAWLLPLIGLLISIASFFAFKIDLGDSTLNLFKSLFVGHEGINRFGVFSYFIIFTTGLSLGYRFNNPENRSIKIGKINIDWFLILGVMSIITTLILEKFGLSSWFRFPPSATFILRGFSYIFISIPLINFISKDDDITNFLKFIGKYSLFFFFINIYLTLGLSMIINNKLFSNLQMFFIHFGLISLSIMILRSYNFIKRFIKDFIDNKELDNSQNEFNTRRIYIFEIFSFISIFISLYILFFLPGTQKVEANNTNYHNNSLEYTSNICANFEQDKDKIIDQININRKWYLKGSEINDTEQIATISVKFSEIGEKYNIAGYSTNIIIEINSKFYHLSPDYNSISSEGIYTQYTTNFSVKDFEINTYPTNIKIITPCEEIIVNGPDIYISYPLYLTWTHDWEGLDVEQRYLDDLNNLSARYSLPMSHFFNPFIYIYLSPYRAQYLTDWVKNRYINNDDSIGLHIHMYPSLVHASGVEPKIDPVKWGTSLPEGYDVLVTNYNTAEMEQILNWSKNQFTAYGLPTPTTYRSGGWFVNTETLRALENTGFVLDSSGRTATAFGYYYIQSPWNLAPDAQPFKPNIYNQNSGESPTFNIWEFPNNGADTYWYTSEELITRFDQNYNKHPLTSKKVYVILSHPHWFDIDRQKFENLMNYIETFTYKSDRGPVVYVNLDDAYNYYTQP